VAADKEGDKDAAGVSTGTWPIMKPSGRYIDSYLPENGRYVGPYIQSNPYKENNRYGVGSRQ
jgi:hypothetical protein